MLAVNTLAGANSTASLVVCQHLSPLLKLPLKRSVVGTPSKLPDSSSSFSLTWTIND
jgi:hypothetical protein